MDNNNLNPTINNVTDSTHTANPLSAWWNRINDPTSIKARRRVRNARRHQNVLTGKQRLKNNFWTALIMLIGAIVELSAFQDSLTAGDPKHVLYAFCATAYIVLFVGCICYRNAIIESKSARIRFEHTLERNLQAVSSWIGTRLRRLPQMLSRVISSILCLALVLVPVAIVLQHIPGLDQHIPHVLEVCEIFVGFIDKIFAKALEYFRA